MSAGRLLVVLLASVTWMVAPAAQGQPPSPARQVWRVDGRVVGVPALEEDVAYFLGKDHSVKALDRASGEVRWEAPTGERGDYTMGSRVVLVDDIVIAGDYGVIGFEKRSGALRWRFDPSEGHAPGVYIGAVHNGIVFTGSAAGRMHALHAASGALRWSANVLTGNLSTVYEPITDGSILFAGYTIAVAPSRGGVVAVDVANGRMLWRKDFPPPSEIWRNTISAGAPVLVDELVIAPSGDGSIHAFERRTGELRWSIPTLEGPFNGIIRSAERDYRPLAIGNGVLVAGSVTGLIVGYDVATRKERWRHDDGRFGSTSLWFASDGQTVYAPYLTGMIVALDIATGRERWRIGDFRHGLMWPPAVDGRSIFAAGPAGAFQFVTE